MNRRNTAVLLVVVVLAGCGREVTRQSVEPGRGLDEVPRTTVRAAGDTAYYRMEFAGKREKRSFARSLDRFLDRYPFDTLRADTVREYLVLRLVTVDTSRGDTATVGGVELDMAVIDGPDFAEADIVAEYDVFGGDSVPAGGTAGGSATLYTERGFLDERLAGFVTAHPFTPPAPEGASDTAGYADTAVARSWLSVSRTSPRAIRVEMARQLRDVSGRAVTTFDLVEAWTALVKTHPAEGLALMKNVAGIEGFIRGEEAIIAGFTIVDERTVDIRLSAPDPDALRRLRSPMLLPPSLRVGPYYVRKRQEKTFVLEPNASYPGQAGYLDRAEIVCGGEKNPFLPFSMNRLQAVMLTGTEDLEYARTTLAKRSKLLELTEDRYFLSVRNLRPELRQYLASRIDRAALLETAAKAEGAVIAAIESDDFLTARPATRPWRGDAPIADKALRIAYRTDDPVSVRIAEKLLAILAPAGLTCRLVGGEATRYEKALVAGDYDLAVGWVSAKVLHDETRRLRLATMWFDGRRDEAARIAEGRELPLFSVKHYLLCKPAIAFDAGSIAGMYLRDR
jgi:hypothetical protein